MKFILIVLLVIGLFTGQSLAGTAVGYVSSNTQQEYNCQLYKAWGWPVETHNFFDPSDDEVKCPSKKMVTLKVPENKEIDLSAERMAPDTNSCYKE